MAEARAGIAARAAAQAILGDVLRRRRPLDLTLEAILGSSGLEPRDAAFARAVASETLRRFGQLDDLIRRFVEKLPPPHRAGPAFEILLAGACELLFLKVPAHAAVDAANALAAADAKAVHFKPLINAVLRRTARDGESLVATQDAARLNTPDWLWTRWLDTYGEDTAQAIGTAHGATPPLDLVTKAQARLVPSGERLPGGVIRLRDPGRIADLPGYAEGQWWVQDFAATLPARLLGEVRGLTAVDLCAAPGGKTAQLAAAGAQVIAVERDESRLQRLRDNLARLRLDAELVCADARDFTPPARAPRVLLDAPCSATGTIRRHPDLPWIKSAADVNSRAQGAGELLEAAADLVADDGLLVFAVCSLEPEEGPEQVADFLGRHAEFRREPIDADDVFRMRELITPDGDLRTLPCHMAEQGGMDGFYAARLRRS